MPTAPEVAPVPPVKKTPANGSVTPPERKEAAAAESSPPKAESRQRITKRKYRKPRVRRHSRSRRHAQAHRSAQAELRAVRHHRKAWHKQRRCDRPRRYRRRHREVRGWSARVYVVRRGDTLSRIAKRHYGSASRARAIYRANRHKIRNPNLIYPRQRLYIP
jgi:nucleoid-associated protein YgaU